MAKLQHQESSYSLVKYSRALPNLENIHSIKHLPYVQTFQSAQLWRITSYVAIFFHSYKLSAWILLTTEVVIKVTI